MGMHGRGQLNNEDASTRKKGKLREYMRQKNRPKSTFFLLWAIISALSLGLTILLGVSQSLLFTQTFKDEAARDISAKGPKIERQIVDGPPAAFGGNYSLFLRMLATENEVNVFIFNTDGELLYPTEKDYEEDNPELDGYFDFTEETEKMAEEIGKGRTAVYEFNGSYVYGAIISIDGSAPVYLYVGQSLHLLEMARTAMAIRTVLICAFGCVLSFAIASAVAGWITHPLAEMTEKATRFAAGDFEIDFHGRDYSLEVTKLAETLNYARDELSKTDRMQKELIANVSHDFKTPLTMIKAYASMIVEISGDNPEKREKHAKIIIEESDRLASLVNDVLDLSKLQAGITELKMERVNVSAVLGEIMDRFAYLKETKAYHFVSDVDGDLYTTADKVKIEQVLYNLIGNAVNYTGEDNTVYVRLKKDGARLRFDVRDTGKGIKPEEINGIWDRYYRSADAHKRPVQGTGLGLSIVKGILDRHGLEYGVESEVGKGSIFFVWFAAE